MADNVLLSICIPTYNRDRYLQYALQSILYQYKSCIEVVVSDNGSSDNTEKIVHEFSKKIKRLTFFRFEKNQGAAANFLKSIEIAQGSYCWFLGSDDKIETGAIEVVLDQIIRNPDVVAFTTNRREYDRDCIKIIKKAPILSNHQISNNEDFLKHIVPRFGFLSSNIFKKSCWDKIILEDFTEKWLDTAYSPYIHTYILSHLFLKFKKWMFIGYPCVGWRSGNDSFLEDLGFLQRMKIDVTGYDFISHILFSENRYMRYKMISNVTKNHLLHQVIGVKLNTSYSVREIVKTISNSYKKNVWFFIIILPLTYLPKSVFLIIKSQKRRYRLIKELLLR